MPDEPAPDPSELKLPLTWVGLDEFPIVLANQFAAQQHDGQFLLTLGQVFPPLLLGSPEERLQQASEIPFVPVRPLGRFTMDEKRMRELLDVLTEHLKQYDEAKGQMEE